MTPLCFFLLLSTTFSLTLKFDDMVLFEGPQRLVVGDTDIGLRDMHLTEVQLPSTTVTFESTKVYLELLEPLILQGTAEVSLASTAHFANASLFFSLSGSVFATKDPRDNCTSSAATVESCDLNARVQIRATDSSTDLDLSIDLCELAAVSMTAALRQQDRPVIEPPSLMTGASSVRRSFFFNYLVWRSTFLGLFRRSVSAAISSDTVVHFHYKVPSPVTVDVNTEEMSGSDDFPFVQVLWERMWDVFRNKLHPRLVEYYNISAVMTDMVSDTVSVSLWNGADFLEAISESASFLLLSSYIPENASVEFDLVAVNQRCNLLGLLCSLPARDGLRVMNMRLTGFGDADSVFGNVLAPMVERALTRVISDVLTANMGKSGDRVILAPFFGFGSLTY